MSSAAVQHPNPQYPRERYDYDYALSPTSPPSSTRRATRNAADTPHHLHNSASPTDMISRATPASPTEPMAASTYRRYYPDAATPSLAPAALPADPLLPRENSTIINHIVVDDPHADLARERARDETRPRGAVDAGDPKRRQEHLRQSAQRKEVKFGDYILGQTLG